MKTKQITQLGLLLSVSLVLAYLESLLPVMVAVPGVKLGLANIVTMLVLYHMGGKQAFFIMLFRVVIAGFLYSGIAGIVYGLVGGVCCIVVMVFLKRISVFSVLGVSMMGAVFHNVGQILVAVIVMENTGVIYYLPVLCISGILSGLIVGYLSHLLTKWYNQNFPED